MIYNHKVHGTSVYVDGARLPQTADVDLPEVEFDADELTAMGMAGVLEVVMPRLSSAMEATIKPKGMSKAVLGKVLGPGNRHEVDVRWVEDGYDAGAKGRVDVPGRAFMVLQPKGFTPGAVTPGEQAEPEIPCSVQYLKVTLDGDVVFEADPAARVLIVNGTDLLAGLNDNL